MSGSISADEYVEKFSGVSRHEINEVEIGGASTLSVRAWPVKDAKSLVVLFHGAVNREKRTLPAFFWWRAGIREYAHQIAFSDPSLKESEDLANGWFAGSEKTPLQTPLRNLVERLISTYGIERVVFAGGSGGGFAALYFSRFFPGSVAAAFLPQTSILDYYPGIRDRYLETCWPDGYEDVDNPPCLDVGKLYSEGPMDNTIIYVQSSLDIGHIRSQLTSFLKQVPRKVFDRLLLFTGFWGIHGHGGSVPGDEMDFWIRAALVSDSTDIESIMDTYHLIKGSQAPRQGVESVPEKGESSDSRALRLTQEITRKLLSRGGL